MNVTEHDREIISELMKAESHPCVFRDACGYCEDSIEVGQALRYTPGGDSIAHSECVERLAVEWGVR